jgi:hypothetical protein
MTIPPDVPVRSCSSSHVLAESTNGREWSVESSTLGLDPGSSRWKIPRRFLGLEGGSGNLRWSMSHFYTYSGEVTPCYQLLLNSYQTDTRVIGFLLDTSKAGNNLSQLSSAGICRHCESMRVCFL